MIGATGATGSQLLRQLLNNPNCAQVTSIGRKPAMGGDRNQKLNDIVLKSLSSLSSTADHWIGNDVFFNCIGTTRKEAGGAKGFIDIEFGISNEAAKFASNANIPHACLISAKGVDHRMWAPHWIHPLLYMKTMGQKEQTIISNYNFNHISIFKPGMLSRLRGENSAFENFLQSKALKLRVDILSSAMMKCAQSVKDGAPVKHSLVLEGNKEIILYLD